MKKNPLTHFPARTALLAFLLLLQQSLTAQIQWYQNQEGPGQYPDGTNAGSIYNFNSNSFIATYLWYTENDQVTWKISRTSTGGTELKTIFISGTYASVEVRVGTNQSVYVLKKTYTPEFAPEFTLYKLNANLQITAQTAVIVPDGFTINSINAFETDGSANLYLAGDGQVDNEGTVTPASFVLKTDKNLVTKWTRKEITETSYTRMHVDKWGIVWVVEDHYSFYPNIKLNKIFPTGQLAQQYVLETDPGRYSLFTAMDDNHNLLIYGTKSVGDTAMAFYLHKFSRNAGSIVYRKNLFNSAGIFINDLKTDNSGNIFTLLTQYQSSGELNCRISRISSGTGHVNWNRLMYYSQDSCSLSKLALAGNDRFYAVGLRSSNNYFSKGFAVRLRKNGQGDGVFISPDSVAFQRTHYLQGAVADYQNRLIAIGTTTDLDTTTFNSTYIRAFAIRLSDNCGDRTPAQNQVITTTEENTESLQAAAMLSVYPNPVTDYLTITGLNDGGYDVVSIYNLAGEKMMQTKVSGNSTKIDASSLIAGVYLVQLKSSATLKEKAVKIVIRK